MVVPMAYSLRGNGGLNQEQPRSWWLQGSRDGTRWTVLSEHNEDGTLNRQGEMAVFPIANPDHDQYRIFRLVQTDKNSSFNSRFHVSGFELFGLLISDHFGNYTEPTPQANYTQRFKGTALVNAAEPTD